MASGKEMVLRDPTQGVEAVQDVNPNTETSEGRKRTQSVVDNTSMVYQRKRSRTDTTTEATTSTRKPSITTEATPLKTAPPTVTATALIKAKSLKDNRPFKTRTSPSGLYNLVRDLSEVQKDAVKAIGFGSLLSLGISKCPMELSRQLVLNFDARMSCLNLYNGQMLSIDEDDVQRVFNLPRGRTVISESLGKTSDGPEYLEMVRAWRSRWVGNPTNGSPSVVSMPARIRANTAGDDDFKRDFVVYVVSSFLYTTQNSQARLKVLKSLMDVEKIKELNWCKFTMDGLINGAENWQGNPTSYFFGPITFLLLCYMDRVVEYSVRHSYNRIFPIVSCVDDKILYERVDAEEKRNSYLRGRVIDRIPLEMECNVEHVSTDVDPPREVDTSTVVAVSLELSRAVERVHDLAQQLRQIYGDAETPTIFPFESSMQSLAETMEIMKGLHSRTEDPAPSAPPAPSPTPPATSPATSPTPSPVASPPAFEVGTSMIDEAASSPCNEAAESDPEEGFIPDQTSPTVPANVEISEEEIPNPEQKKVKGKRTIRCRRPVFNFLEEEPTDLVVTEPIDAEILEPVPVSIEMPQPRTGRKYKKLPAVLRSPYLDEIHSELPQLSPLFHIMADIVFGDELDETELLYSSGNTSLTRNVLRTTQQGHWLHSGIIDAWAHDLNLKTHQVSSGSKRRIFFSTMHSACLEFEADMYNAILLEECRTFGISVEDIQNAELIFLPIRWADHYYLGVFNRTTTKFEIIDNRPLPKGIPFKAKYAVVPLVTKKFLGFLDSLDKDLSSELMKFKPKFLKLSWQDNENTVDCGVFCMLHMDQYLGKTKDWDCGLKLVNVSKKLHSLRIQYLARILLSDNNNQTLVIKHYQNKLSRFNVI